MSYTLMPRALTKLFRRVHAAHAQQGQLRGHQRRAAPGQVGQALRPVAQQAGHGHAVQIATGAGGGGVGIGMGIQPQHFQALAALAAVPGHSADGAHGQAAGRRPAAGAGGLPPAPSATAPHTAAFHCATLGQMPKTLLRRVPGVVVYAGATEVALVDGVQAACAQRRAIPAMRRGVWPPGRCWAGWHLHRWVRRSGRR